MTSVEKFIEAMNKVSGYWAKDIKVTAQDGKIVVVECDGWKFKDDDSNYDKEVI